MSMLERRLQILLDRERYDRLAREAEARGTSVAQVVRDAIDWALPSTSRRRQEAASRILQAPDMPVPDVAELRSELDELRSGGR
jgi:hypothetical protein